MGWVHIALCTIAIAACSKSKAECQRDVDALMTFLRSFDHEPALFQIDETTKLVMRDALPKVKQYAPTIEIRADVTIFHGRLVDGPALGDALAEARERIERDPGPPGEPRDPRLLYFQISSDATWDRVVAASQAAADAGFTHASFVFAAPSTATPPPRTWVDDRFDAIRARGSKDGAWLATELAGSTRDIIGSCPALKRAYGAVGAMESGDKAGFLIEATGRALLECNCAVELPALRSSMWLLLANPHPTGVAGVTLDKAAPPLALPATTPWRDAGPQLVPGATTWLVAS
jgi:hypothetical protein